MLNLIAVEGLVTKQRWPFGNVRFLRLACYPDPGRSIKRPDGRIDVPDYITIRCEGQLALAADSLEPGDRVQVYGALTSREYEIDLADFAHKAKGAEGDLAKMRELAGAMSVAMPHVLTEILVERLAVVERHRRAEPPEPERTDRRRRPDAAAPRSAPSGKPQAVPGTAAAAPAA